MVVLTRKCNLFSVEKSDLIRMQSSFVWRSQLWANTCSTGNSISFWCFYIVSCAINPKLERVVVDTNLCRLEVVCSSCHHYTWWERRQPLCSHVCNKTSQKPRVWSLLLIFCHEVVERVWHTVLWNPTSKIKSALINDFLRSFGCLFKYFVFLKKNSLKVSKDVMLGPGFG